MILERHAKIKVYAHLHAERVEVSFRALNGWALHTIQVGNFDGCHVAGVGE